MKNLKFLLFAIGIGIAASLTIKAAGNGDDLVVVGGRVMKKSEVPQPKNADLTAAEVLDDLFNKNSKANAANVEALKEAEDRRRGQQMEEVARGPDSTFQALQDDQQQIQANARAAVASVNADIASEEKKAELEKQGFWQKPVMASDQGQNATESFMQAVGATKDGGAITSGAKAAVDQMLDDARDAAKDAARDARQAATDAARQAGADAARSSRDNCPHGAGCH